MEVRQENYFKKISLSKDSAVNTTLSEIKKTANIENMELPLLANS
jgi:hypothetical protein